MASKQDAIIFYKHDGIMATKVTVFFEENNTLVDKVGGVIRLRSSIHENVFVKMFVLGAPKIKKIAARPAEPSPKPVSGAV